MTVDAARGLVIMLMPYLMPVTVWRTTGAARIASVSALIRQLLRLLLRQVWSGVPIKPAALGSG